MIFITLHRKMLKELPKHNGYAVSCNPTMSSVIHCNEASYFLSAVSAHNLMLMCLTSYLGKNKAPIAEVLTAMLRSFEDVTKNHSKADDSRREK